MNQLEKLLYRKSSLENLMNIWTYGIKLYSEYIDNCKKIVGDKNSSEFDVIEAKKNIHEAQIPLKHYITSHKLALRERDHYLLPEIEKHISEEEKKNVDFDSLKKQLEELAEIEIYGNYQKQPENVELIGVSKDIQNHIELLQESIDACAEAIQKSKDEYETSKLKLDMFKMNLQLMTNNKRLKERQDYYYNVFKPKYDKDMVEAEEYLPKLLDRAKEIVKEGIDIKLGFLLQEYEKNKEDKEKVWLFYTALKSRLKKIGKEMRKPQNKGALKGKMHLAKDII